MTLTDDFIQQVEDTVQQQITDNWSYAAFGDDGSSEDAADNALGNELLRKAVLSTSETGSVVTVSSRLAATELNGETLREHGIFDASSGGEMKVRDVFAEVNKTQDIEVYVDTSVDVQVSEV